ncbi:hypothetical protein LBMAG20_17150 [Methylocystaceae bacterium]|nr:hypothetical protein LBMAG20_17150 [Methylocystaceae bacterium]
MGLERSWLDQALTLPPGFNQEEAEAFWRTYNLKRARKYAEYIDKDATRDGLIAALSSMEYRVVNFQNIKLH